MHERFCQFSKRKEKMTVKLQILYPVLRLVKTIGNGNVKRQIPAKWQSLGRIRNLDGHVYVLSE